MKKFKKTKPPIEIKPPAAIERIFSVGFSCQFLQVLPAELFSIMNKLEFSFVREVDGVGYLDEADLNLISQALTQIRSAAARPAEHSPRQSSRNPK